jgi:hypothetical protein
MSWQLQMSCHVAFVICDNGNNVETGVTVSAGRYRYWCRCVPFTYKRIYEKEMREETPL